MRLSVSSLSKASLGAWLVLWGMGIIFLQVPIFSPGLRMTCDTN